MEKYLILVSFPGALQGCYVVEYVAGQTVEIPDPDLVAVALAEGWITPVDDLSGAPPADTRVKFIVLKPTELPGFEQGWEGDLPKLGDIILFEEEIAKPLLEEGVIAVELPAEYGRYVALEEIQLPGTNGDLTATGAAVVMGVNDAHEYVEAGLLALQGSDAANAAVGKAVAEDLAAEKARKKAKKAAAQAAKENLHAGK